MTAGYHDSTRTTLTVSGGDARSFLQGLITNDMDHLDREDIIYSALLTPQGKYLFDFFVLADPEGYLLDVASGQAQGLMQRLSMYRLRADVGLSEAYMAVVRGTGDLPAGAVADPRNPALGWRLYTADPATVISQIEALDPADLETRRILHGVPETGSELIPDDSYILEMDFERLNGVDFRKGCYVGQEVTARMKHKTTLRKGLARVRVEAPAPPPGTEIFSDGKVAGVLHSVADDMGLAYLRFDRATDPMTAAGVPVKLLQE